MEFSKSDFQVHNLSSGETPEMSQAIDNFLAKKTKLVEGMSKLVADPDFVPQIRFLKQELIRYFNNFDPSKTCFILLNFYNYTFIKQINYLTTSQPLEKKLGQI